MPKVTRTANLILMQKGIPVCHKNVEYVAKFLLVLLCKFSFTKTKNFTHHDEKLWNKALIETLKILNKNYF